MGGACRLTCSCQKHELQEGGGKRKLTSTNHSTHSNANQTKPNRRRRLRVGAPRGRPGRCPAGGRPDACGHPRGLPGGAGSGEEDG
jgi:hypothetical protein